MIFVKLLKKFFYKNIIIEYVWLDGGYTPTVRSIVSLKSESIFNFFTKVDTKSFAGMSTMQATEESSDCVLVPVCEFNNPFYKNGKLVMCEVYDNKGEAHGTNKRNKLRNIYRQCKQHDCLVGIEQEYYLSNSEILPTKSDFNYCGVGNEYISHREIVSKHMNYCLRAGIKFSGYNAESTRNQWEFQLGPLDPLSISDQLWIARYILLRICEEYQINIIFDPVPYSTEYNMSGAHVNFSDKYMRLNLGIENIKKVLKSLSGSHLAAILTLGSKNEVRLENNNLNYRDFTFGELDRSASIRIPFFTVKNKKGYFEDRRPGADLDPYTYLSFLISKIYNITYDNF